MCGKFKPSSERRNRKEKWLGATVFFFNVTKVSWHLPRMSHSLCPPSHLHSKPVHVESPCTEFLLFLLIRAQNQCLKETTWGSGEGKAWPTVSQRQQLSSLPTTGCRLQSPPVMPMSSPHVLLMPSYHWAPHMQATQAKPSGDCIFAYLMPFPEMSTYLKFI